MKKCLLTALSAFMLLPAGAFTLQQAPYTGNDPVRKPAKASDSESYIVYGYCQDYYTGLGTGGTGDKLYAAIEIPADVASSWVGNQLSSVRIALGPSSSPNVTLFLTEELGNDSDGNFPFYTQNVRLSTTEGWNEVKLDTPYDIEGKKFYIGYQIVSQSSKDYPIGVDGIGTNNTYADIIGVNGNWTHVGTQYGSVCIEALISGDALPQNDVAVNSLQLPTNVALNQPFGGVVSISNKGALAVSSLEVSCAVNGEKLDNISYTLTPEVLNPGETAELKIENIICSELGANMPVVVTIDKVNGNDDEAPYNNEASGKVYCAETVYPRNVVVEEWTGTWCGWCVRGIVGMEYMNRKYGNDGFIGIAVHSGDAMESRSYSGFIQRYGGSFPGCIVNRKTSGDANQQFMEATYLSERANPALMQVKADVSYSEENPSVVNVDATVNFAVSSSIASYRLAFALLENNVGPYPQNNSYAGGNNGVMGGWESKSGNESTYFNDVAREINAWQGATSSLPGEVESGVDYTYSATLSASSVKNIDNCELVAMIINSRTSEIENACKVKITGNTPAGVDKTVSNLSIRGGKGMIFINGDYTSCSVYALDGTQVKNVAGVTEINVAPGLYIVKATTGDNETIVRKIMVK